MDAKTVFTKTAKGVTQVNQKTQSLSRQLTKVLKAVDGKSTLTALSDKVDLPVPVVEKDLNQLKKDGYIKVFEVKQEVPLSDFGGDDDDFDFTSPTKMASALREPVVAFGPSKYRAGGLNEQVAPATPASIPPPADDAAAIAAQIAARKKQEEDARIAAEALEAAKRAAQQAQMEARARAEREAQIRARLEVEARARKDAETRAIEEARRAEEAAAKSRAELEVKLADEARKRAQVSADREKMTQEQQAREADAQRVLAEARAKAEAEAKAFAAARVKIESEAKALADARALAEAAARRQEEELAAAQRALRAQLKAEIEAKVRAEMEELLRSDIEESAREEVEAAVMEEAREEARRQLEAQLKSERDALAQVEAEAKARAEQDAKRMLAEQEARLRAEMEARLQEIAAEKAAAEIEARNMAEAKAEAASRAAEELAARLRAEEEARKRAEAESIARKREADAERAAYEARAREEAAARARAAEEAREAAQAAALLTARLKAEEEARAQMTVDAENRRKAEELRSARLEARAREESELRQKAEAEMQATVAAEREARLEAEARAREEDLAKRATEAELEAARRSRDEAEDKARRESRAREIASQAVAAQVAEKEKLAELAEQRLAQEREAREKAEAKAYADERAEAAQRAAQVARLKELADQAERQKYEAQDVSADGKKKRYKPKKEVPVGRLIVVGVIALIVLAVVLVQVVPLGAANARLEKALAQWTHDDVNSAGLRIAFFPKPHVKLDQISLGKAFDAKAQSGKLYMDLSAVFGDRFVIDTVELSDITVSAEALPRLLKWADPTDRGKQIEIDRIVLRNVKLEVRGVALEVFDAELAFDRSGRLIKANTRTRDGKWTLDAALAPIDKSAAPDAPPAAPTWLFDFAARNWTPPVGAITFAVLAGKGTMTGDDIVFPEMEAKVLEGSAKGNLRINVKNGIVAQSDFTLERARVDELVGIFTRDISVSGRMEGNFTAAVNAPTVAQLFDQPAINGNFAVREGLISNVDLVQAMRNPGNVGGQTKFGELTGKLRVSEGMVRFEAMKLSGGVLFAGGNVNVAYGKDSLGGTVTAEIRSNVAQDRAVFALSGSVARPVLRRGG